MNVPSSATPPVSRSSQVSTITADSKSSTGTSNVGPLPSGFISFPSASSATTAAMNAGDDHNVFAALVLAEEQRRKNVLLSQLLSAPSITAQDLLLEDIRQRERLVAQREASLMAAAASNLPLRTNADLEQRLLLSNAARNVAALQASALPLSQFLQGGDLQGLLALQQGLSVPLLAAAEVQAATSSANGSGAEQQQQQQEKDKPSPQPKRKGRTGTFPRKLHLVLANLEDEEGGSDIASFMPHGKAFAIHKPKEFAETVMVKYFRMSRFSSFQRQLNLYDFERITDGPDKGGYRHKYFIKSDPGLVTKIKRNKIKGHGKTSVSVIAETATAAAASAGTNNIPGHAIDSGLLAANAISPPASAFASPSGLGLGFAATMAPQANANNLQALRQLGGIGINDSTTLGDLRRLLAARQGL